MIVGKDRIVYVVADLKRIGPTNQTFNIIRYSKAINNCVVITLFKECDDSRIDDYIAAGIDVICLNLSRKNVLLQGTNKLRDTLKQLSPYAVHSWGTYADIISHYACKKSNIPHIITLRCFPMEDAPTRMNPIIGYGLAFCVLHIYKNSKYIVACSKSIKDKMENSYKWASLSYIQNGVDIERFKQKVVPAHIDGIDAEKYKYIFISMGSMIPRKRIPETVKGFVKSKRMNDSLLLFLGSGILLDKYRKEFGTENIRFLGKKDNVEDYLSISSSFISSSESEGMPNAVLESIACGVPVILSNIEQHNEILSELGYCGESYSLGIDTELSDILDNINDQKLNEMKRNCNNIFHSNLNMRNMGRLYEKFYSEI